MNNIYIIPLILASAMGLYVFALSYAHFSEKEFILNKKNANKLIIIATFISLNSVYSPVYFSVPASLILYILLFYSIFKDDFYRLIHLSIYICLLSLIADYILLFIFNVCCNNVYNIYKDAIIGKTIFSILFNYVYYFIYKLRFFKTIYVQLYLVFKGKKQTLIILLLLFGLIIFFCLFFSVNLKMTHIYLIALFELGIIVSICYFYLKEAKINLDLRIKNNYLTENKILFEQHIEDYQLLKHNLVNDLIFVKSLCPDNVQVVLNEKIKKFTAKNDVLSKIKHVPEGLQGIIFIKSCVAKHNKINFYVDNQQVTNLNFKKTRHYIELCEIVSELLDNAIEASSKTKAKVIYITIFKDEKYKKIKIINSYCNEINLDKIGSKNYTTKESGNGIGLYYISNLNKNLKINTSIKDNLFEVEIKISLKDIIK